MRTTLLALALVFTQHCSAQVKAIIDNNVYLIADSSLSMVVDSGSITNNGKYYNPAGNLSAYGGLSFNGTGRTDLWDLNIDNTGTTNINSLVSVYNTADLAAGQLNANNNLYIRSDVSSTANLVVSGVLSGNVKGLSPRTPVVSAPCTLNAHLSLNISGAPVLYQWQVSADSISWSNISTATEDTFTAAVYSHAYYRCHLTTTNSAFDEYTPGIKLYLTSFPVTPSVSINTDHGDTVCPGTLTRFAAFATNGGTVPQYTWYVNGAVQNFGDLFYYTPTNGDIVSVTLISDAPCAMPVSVGKADTMVVEPTAVPVIVITASPTLMIAPGEYDTLTATITNSGIIPVYQWVVNGTYIAGATSATYISNSFNDGDSVTCYVVNNGPCGMTLAGQTYVVHVQNDGLHTIRHASGISLLPNPNNGVFTVKGKLDAPDGTNITLTIENMLGQELYRVDRPLTSNSLNEKIDVGNKLAKGMYLLHLLSTAGSSTIRFEVL